MPRHRVALLFLLAAALVAKTGSTQQTTPAPQASTDQKDAANATAIPDAADLKLPPGPPTGPRHIATGTLHAAQCYYPTTLMFLLEEPKTTVFFYSNNYFKIPFYTTNFKPDAPLNPCKSLNGLKAKVTYAVVNDKRVAGQIYQLDLSK
jgi:hypothetical protein